MSTVEQTSSADRSAARWNLSALFESPDDPKIDEAWTEAHRRADAFAAKYRGRIDRADLDPEVLLAALTEIESILQDASKPAEYASLVFAANVADPRIGAFLQDQMEKSSELRVKLMFFELELQTAPEEAVARCLADDRLANYRHYVQVSRKFAPYRLSEKEEVLLEEVANSGSRAWVRLHEEITSNHVFRLRMDGEEVSLTLEEVLTRLRSPRRPEREAAADALTRGLKELERVLVFTYNNLLLDKKIDDRLRGFDYAEQSRHMTNELDRETVDLVVGLCKEREEMVARYYRVKRRLLGLPELTHVDRYAPLGETVESIEYDRARSIVLDAFRRFSPEMADRAQEFFDREWIDAEPRAGKSSGAFCSYVTPDLHPVVFMSYLGKLKDVMTLAHELGHGVHASFSREQTLLNYHGTLPLAELASTFGEQLVFDRLVADAKPEDRIALYADKIESSFATVFRQAAMFRFEQRCHAKRREEGELSPDEFGDIWQDELQSMFGDSLRLGDDHRIWWSYVGHFIGAPFYVYAYAFGELLALSLYARAKEQGPAFAEDYVRLLRLGGSLAPAELMGLVGVDLNSRVFWLGGLRAIEEMIDTFESISGA